MPAIPVSTGLQAAPTNAWIDGPVQIVLSTEGGVGGGAERPAIAPWPCEWESCTGNCTAERRECMQAYAPGRLGSRDYEDAADPPLGWRGRLVLIGLLGISAAVGISGVWLLLDWFRHLAGGG